MGMFCRQCEQTAGGQHCTVRGVCGKNEDTAVLQDLLIELTEAIGYLGEKLKSFNYSNSNIDLLIVENLFTTVTNVNFDPKRIETMIRKTYQVKEELKDTLLNKDYKEKLPDKVNTELTDTFEKLLERAHESELVGDSNVSEDIKSLREILLYGLKGMAAYYDHAFILGKEDLEVAGFFYKGLASLINDGLGVQDYLNLIMEFGKVNLRCLELLDQAHNDIFGTPGVKKVSLSIKKGPAIIVSGHDLEDLKQLLEQTKGKGINIYTHGEMLPAHGYPELNKYQHLAGHFGSAWQNQQKEFDNIEAAILMTTNCIQEPKTSYSDRIFTTGLVAWPGTEHIEENNGKKDFSKVIDKAFEIGGFKEEKEGKEILVGFGHKTVLSLADKIIEAVKAKSIRHFYLIGGCDGARPGRNYFTEFAQKVPKDCMILTLACGKFRFNYLDFGTIGDFPRLLDCGQCNDAYSAVKIAMALAKAFDCSVNDLPLSFILSWYEQKAVCILLSLLSLGIKDIRLGPTLPAFVSENVLKVLVDKFNIKPITTVQEDLAQTLGGG